MKWLILDRLTLNQSQFCRDGLTKRKNIEFFGNKKTLLNRIEVALKFHKCSAGLGKTADEEQIEEGMSPMTSRVSWYQEWKKTAVPIYGAQKLISRWWQSEHETNTTKQTFRRMSEKISRKDKIIRINQLLKWCETTCEWKNNQQKKRPKTMRLADWRLKCLFILKEKRGVSQLVRHDPLSREAHLQAVGKFKVD